MTRKERFGTIAILGSLAALGPFSIDMYLPGFSAIASDLKTSVASVGYSLTSYFIGIAAGQLVYGPLTDRYGRRRPLLIGLVIYIAATAACALTPSIGWLIGMRLLMALGGCVGVVMSRAIARDRFPVSELSGVFSSFMLVIAISPILAPSVGGFVAETLGWRDIFILLALIAVALFVVVLLRLKESKTPDPAISFYPSRIIRLYREIAGNKQFAVFAAVGSLGSASTFAYLSAAPFVFMHLFRLSESQFGLVFALNASGLIVGSQVNRLAIKRFASRSIAIVCVSVQIIIGGLLVFGIALGVMSLADIVAMMILFLFCSGLVNPNASALALEPFETNAGSASALLGCMQMGIGALATALVSLFANGTALPMAIGICGCAVLSRFVLTGARGRHPIPHVGPTQMTFKIK